MDSFLAIVSVEFEAWQAAPDKRAYVGQRAGTLYDTFIAPLDIPYVPEAAEKVVDSIGRESAVKTATAVYDAITAKLAAGEAVGWPAPVTEA